MLKRILITTVGTLMLLGILGLGFVVAAPNPQAPIQDPLTLNEIAEADYDLILGVDWFAIVAEALELDEDAFWTALEANQSIAQLAETQGIAPQTLIDAIVTAETTFIEQLVADEDISAEEAVEWKTDLAQEAADFINDEFLLDVMEGVDWFAIVAEELGLDDETLWLALEDEQSIAQLAEAQDIAPQTLIDAIIAAETAFIDQLVADEDITVEESAEWKTDVAQEAADFVNETWDWDEVEGVDWFAIVAEGMGLDDETLWLALEDEQSIAQLAEAQDIAPQTLIDAIVTAETAFIDQLVADEVLTAEEAAEWKTDIAAEATTFVNEVWDWDDVEVEEIEVEE